MSEQQGGTPDRPRRPGNPVVVGLVALVGVALALGLVVGAVAIVGLRAAGVDSERSTGDAGADASMYLPSPERTSGSAGPLITLAADPSSSAPTASARPTRKPSASPSTKAGINLTAGTTAAGPMERIDLTGTYADGEGAVLQVQRFAAGAWQDFDVTMVVSNGAFSTYVQTGQLGANRFRVIDTDSRKASNSVTVTVG